MALKHFGLLTMCLEQLILSEVCFCWYQGLWFGFGMTWWHNEAVEITFRSVWNEKKIAMMRWLTNEKKCNCVKEKSRGLLLQGPWHASMNRGLLSRSACHVISIMSLNVSLYPMIRSCSEGIRLPIGEAWQSCFSKMSWYYYLTQIFSFFFL